MSDRFWSKVEKTDGCWNWLAAKDRDGYGMIYWDHKVRRTHRISWEMARGPLPSEAQVLRECDNPSCVNPSHMFLGDHQTNMDDRNKKGRTAKGSNGGQSKLTEPKVLEIVSDVRRNGLSYKAAAEKYGISTTQIGSIVTGLKWGHLTGIVHAQS